MSSVWIGARGAGDAGARHIAHRPQPLLWGGKAPLTAKPLVGTITATRPLSLNANAACYASLLYIGRPICL